ncbi:MBL fold metallo-hydrolase [Paraferrimonas sp. SM1919]|uniref:MBL fold metallo-hydrolase n=1 Tax=Paraferrimonas sp. SM1919 TaxID=2662263 RepID=UPI0013D7650C|nr:MBL fold metallo-hydrolase [Paraferrimonas sp. SM1919]
MKIHQLSGYIQNIYLAVYADKIMLLDGCSKTDLGLIEHYIVAQLQRPITDLKVVVVTHMHPDHAGAANSLKKRFGCKLVTGSAKGHWYSGWDGWIMFVTDVVLGQWVAARLGKTKRSLWFWPRPNSDYKLNDGELIPDFEDWQVIDTQGHTDRDISLFHIPTKTVYVADLAVKVKDKIIPPFPIFYPNRYASSLAKVEALKPKRVILAHGGDVQISHEEYLYLVSKAPKKPTTHWRVTKAKLKKLLFW